MYLFSKFSGVDPVAVKKIIVTRYNTTLFYVFLQFCNKKEPLKKHLKQPLLTMTMPKLLLKLLFLLLLLLFFFTWIKWYYPLLDTEVCVILAEHKIRRSKVWQYVGKPEFFHVPTLFTNASNNLMYLHLKGDFPLVHRQHLQTLWQASCRTWACCL